MLRKKFIELNTNPIRFGDIPSKNSEHYYYNKSADINSEIGMLFSNQSMLFYIERFKSKYNSLYELLLKEKISLEDFYNYQKESIAWLIKRNTLTVADGTIKLNIRKVILLKLLYEDNVIILTKFNKQQIMKILQNEEHVIKNTLLTRREVEYYDYFLNDRYTNGRHIRNKYSHLPTSKDEDMCKQDYYTIVRLIIILIIKINDDLCTYYDNLNEV